ncbi:hypothetical protein IC617_04080 [Neiella sp. HB171785]|uniref:Zinc finger DksA/TraR C4-type domain-containing protein n=1 Tax=Neiella litorisoli TaxID=2771431 RepID=A0A8J6QHJ2_9GAMM|nr:TraR/DksA C4-type zinc finger protein [Neiella litorisoli]MBD1388598.1 hypothetical protein [Neiella litorisoli]
MAPAACAVASPVIKEDPSYRQEISRTAKKLQNNLNREQQNFNFNSLVGQQLICVISLGRSAFYTRRDWLRRVIMVTKQHSAQLERFKKTLESEHQLLIADLAMALNTIDTDNSRNVLATIKSLSCDDLVELLADEECPEVNRTLKRLRAVDASLCQTELGLYGFCADCEKPIELEMLQRDATVQRCYACDQIHRHVLKNNKRILL